MSISAMEQAYTVPLIEQLESVPADARMMYEHDKFHHENIPVGRLCREAAEALRQAIADAEQPDLARVGEVGVWGDKREWVGFTHEELAWLNEALNLGGRFAVIEAIEAKLKEKNT